ncbi:hypothetical protein P280DRAFT_176578 [Massarina eburnea CBS 473.64]|uniref:Uncharacterized protein n=1 Tax=Massarina eburnea CBS 473.64 TaxID=1395130 RepID=A0A6A6SA78_9PLEO|nr:hypothetical protein P280DRAFT_176578 [Massarina eburnea CBS 473.64]
MGCRPQRPLRGSVLLSRSHGYSSLRYGEFSYIRCLPVPAAARLMRVIVAGASSISHWLPVVLGRPLLWFEWLGQEFEGRSTGPRLRSPIPSLNSLPNSIIATSHIH